MYGLQVFIFVSCLHAFFQRWEIMRTDAIQSNENSNGKVVSYNRIHTYHNCYHLYSKMSYKFIAIEKRIK